MPLTVHDKVRFHRYLELYPSLPLFESAERTPPTNEG